MVKRVIKLVLITVLVVSLISFIVASIDESKSVSPPKTQERVSIDWISEQGEWRNQFKKENAHDIYREIIKRYRSNDFSDQHLSLHFFGELLYEKLGIEGIDVCDSTYSYGCYHGIIGQSIIENGVDILPQIVQMCESFSESKGINCQHGLGHGILSQAGHADLQQALNTCQSLFNKESLLGCEGGVFMEYNFPFSHESGIVERKVNSKNPYQLCESVADRFKPACYYSLGHLLGAINFRHYATAGTICNGIEIQNYKALCFLGVGWSVVITSNLNINRIHSFCSLMPGSFGKKYCLAGGYYGVRNIKGADKLCKNISSEFEEDCLSMNLFNQVVGSQ